MKKFLTALFTTLLLLGLQVTSCTAETVSVNTTTLKYHNIGCRYFNCKSCVKMEKEKAIKKGAKPCKVCGG